MPKLNFLVAALAVAVATSAQAASDNLTWTNPTTRVNGVALSAAELQSAKIYKNGNLYKTVPATQTSFVDSAAVGCSPSLWAVSVVDTAGIESASATATGGIDSVGCVPKAPSNLTVTPK